MQAILTETEIEQEKYNYKLSDEEFLDALKQNFCLYSDAAKYISRKYGIPYSKQAVRQRAKKFEEEIKRFKEEIHDLALRTIYESVKQDKDMKLRYRAAIFMLGKLDRSNTVNNDATNTD